MCGDTCLPGPSGESVHPGRDRRVGVASRSETVVDPGGRHERRSGQLGRRGTRSNSPPFRLLATPNRITALGTNSKAPSAVTMSSYSTPYPTPAVAIASATAAGRQSRHRSAATIRRLITPSTRIHETLCTERTYASTWRSTSSESTATGDVGTGVSPPRNHRYVRF